MYAVKIFFIPTTAQWKVLEVSSSALIVTNVSAHSGIRKRKSAGKLSISWRGARYLAEARSPPLPSALSRARALLLVIGTKREGRIRYAFISRTDILSQLRLESRCRAVTARDDSPRLLDLERLRGAQCTT